VTSRIWLRYPWPALSVRLGPVYFDDIFSHDIPSSFAKVTLYIMEGGGGFPANPALTKI
jgi:hypothetical protein